MSGCPGRTRALASSTSRICCPTSRSLWYSHRFQVSHFSIICLTATVALPKPRLPTRDNTTVPEGTDVTISQEGTSLPPSKQTQSLPASVKGEEPSVNVTRVNWTMMAMRGDTSWELLGGYEPEGGGESSVN